MPSSTATVTVSNPGAAKHSQSATTPSAPNAPQNPGSKSASLENAVGKSGQKAPLPLQKQRKGSLSAVIDKLKQQQHPHPRKDHSLSKKIEKIEKSAEAAGKKDAITEKKKLDDIRNAILMAGSQPHPPKSSQRKSEFEPGFTRIEKSGKLDFNRGSGSGTPPASLPSIPIPKISKTSGASPAAPPSTPIPKLSNTTKSNTGGNVSKFNASGSVLSRSASNMTGAPSESNSNHGNRNSGPGVKDSAYSNKGSSGGPSHELEKERPSGGPGPPGRNFQGPPNPSQFAHNKPPSLLGKDFPRPPGLANRDPHAGPSHNYGQNLHNNKDAISMVNSNSDESAKRIKLDDSLDRSQGRHFLDAIGLGASTSQKKGDHPGNPSGNKDHKSGLKRTGSSSNLDTNPSHHNHGNGDKGSRLNGHNRIPNSNVASSDGLSRNSPKEEGSKTDKFNSAKDTYSTYNSGTKPGLDGAVNSANLGFSSNPAVDRTKTGSKVNSSDVNNRTTKQSSSHSDILTGGNTSSSSSPAQSGSLSKVTQSNSLAGNASSSSSSCHSNSGSQGNVKLTNSHDTPPGSTTASSSAIHSNDTRHNVVSPSVNKQDSVFDDKENTIASPDPGEDSVFKAPTPKPIRLEAEGHESAGRAPRLEKIKPIRSPCSNPSSPEDSLIIDCPGTPTSNKSVKSPSSRSNDRSPVTVARTKSPVVVNAVTSGGTSTVPADVKNKSPAGVVSIANAKNLPPPRSPSPRKTLTPTLTSKLPPPASPSPPPKSPMMQHNSPVVARQPPASPCDLDDDLMDEALIL